MSGVNMVSNSAYNASYIVIGYGGSVNNFSSVLYPAMSLHRRVADTTICEMCHASGTENNDPIGLLAGGRSAGPRESHAGDHFGVHRLPPGHGFLCARGFHDRSQVR